MSEQTANLCTTDACEAMRAQLPSQGGEAVGVVLTEEQMGIGYDRRTGPVLWFGGYPKGGSRLYTHPADQVAEPDAELVELLARCRKVIAHEVESDWPSLGELIERIDAKLASLK